jgi:MFS family permease
VNAIQKPANGFPPHFRWNFAAFLTDYVCFSVAFTFVSLSSVMPAFVGELTTSAPVIGLVNTIFQGGWLLPQLIIARTINDKPYKKPYMVAAISGRITFWFIVLALMLGLSRRPTAMLVLFFVSLGLFAVTDGFASVAWFDILARAIPVKRRGRLVGMGQFISGALGIGVGALVALILDRTPFPTNYAILFALASLTLIPSAVALILIREPAPKAPDPTSDVRLGRDVWRILITDAAFRRLIACRLLVGMMSLATSFYVIHASERLHLPATVIGQFVSVQTLANVISSPILGWASERWGPRYVARVAGAFALAGPLFALIVDQVGSVGLSRAYPLVYAALGIVNSAWMLGFSNYLLEIAPERLRPAYVGLGNTVAGVLMATPMVGGWLLQATSYATLFGVTTAIVTIGFLLTMTLPPPPEAAVEEAM